MARPCSCLFDCQNADAARYRPQAPGRVFRIKAMVPYSIVWSSLSRRHCSQHRPL